ncbi:hypothetical protein FAI41_06130 [Acetobacteraceae bacterium]|nr:hypothetical protein FAI41_06130 [Acetobacteraceae bacterium]
MPELKIPSEALALVHQNAKLLDIREPEEFLRDHIEGAMNVPLSGLDNPPHFKEDIVIMCQSGRRTGEHNYPLFRKMSSGKIYILKGGLNAWNAEKLTKNLA